MNRRSRRAAIVAASLFGAGLLADAASAMCPSPAYYASRGALSFTARVVAAGPSTSLAPFPPWFDVQVTHDSSGRFAGRTVRVRTPDMAMYTARFTVGETYRMSVLEGPDGLTTSACMMQR